MMQKTYTNLFTNPLAASVSSTSNTKVSDIDSGYHIDTLVTNTSSPDNNITLNLPSASYHFHCKVNIVKVTTKPDYYLWSDGISIRNTFAGGVFDADFTGSLSRISIKSGNTTGDAVEFTDIILCTQADWQDLKALNVAYISGTSYELGRAPAAAIPSK
jgi:hypothetical protein